MGIHEIEPQLSRLSRRRKITFPIRSMLAKQVGYDQVYRRTASL